MHTPTPAQLLQVWEVGGELSATARSLLLLASSCEDCPAETLATLPLGGRDALLLKLRKRLFGEAIDVLAHCPQCAAPVEASFNASDLLLVPAAESTTTVQELVASVNGTCVPFRLPDSNDLLALERCGDAVVARQLLLERCLLSADVGANGDARALPAPLQATLVQAMAKADPQADLQLGLRCPDCGHDWQPPFDIARFLWQELHAWALRMLREVDLLAQAYHWGEADILGLSPRRRQAYLELCAP